MICVREKLDAYLDGELAPADAAAMEAHLEGCPACSAEALARMQLKRSVRAAAFAYQPSAELRNRIAAQIAPKRRPLRFFRNPVLLAAISAVLIVVIAAPLLARHYAHELASAELLDLHVATLASANPVDVLSSDRHTVKPWFQGKIPFAFNLPEFSGSEFTLLGARLVYLHQQAAAQLVVGAGKHRISVMVVQDNAGFGTGLPFAGGVSVRDSFNVETWEKNGLRFYVIGDAEQGTIHRLATALQRVNG